jgi:hypothetical protein
LYCGHWFRKPAVPLARCTGCAGFLRLTDWATVKPPSEPSSSLPFLQSVAQLDLRPPAAAGGHLSWTFVPFSTYRIWRSTHHGRSKPATVRVQGLATLVAVFARRIRAGFVSRRQRSWDSPFGAFSSKRGADAFPRLRTHLPFLPPGYSRRTRRRAGPGGRGFWGLALVGVPRTVRVISPHDGGGSRGLFPFRVCRCESWQSVPCRLLRALRSARVQTGRRRLGVFGCPPGPGRARF